VVEVLTDRCVAQVGGHGEVGDETDKGSQSPEVVEDSLTVGGSGTGGGSLDSCISVIRIVLAGCSWDGSRLVGKQSPGEPGEESETKDSHYGPKPVGSMFAELSVCVWRVNVQSIVVAADKVHGWRC